MINIRGSMKFYHINVYKNIHTTTVGDVISCDMC